jgi:RNA polymerase sigma factor (sigma-70 family)
MQPTHKKEDNWSRLLIRVGKQRDRAAFEVIYNHFAPLIKGFIFSRARAFSVDFADTIVRDVMLKIWQKAPYFDPSRISGTSWIFTVVRNVQIESTSQRTMRSDMQTTSHPIPQNSTLQQGNEAGVPEGLTVDDIWDDTRNNEPFVFLQRSKSEDAVQQCLQNLPLEQYHIVKKVYVEGKSHQTIAAELGLPLATVESRVRLALRKLEKSARPHTT